MDLVHFLHSLQVLPESLEQESHDLYYLLAHLNLPSLATHSPLHMHDNRFDIYLLVFLPISIVILQWLFLPQLSLKYYRPLGY